MSNGKDLLRLLRVCGVKDRLCLLRVCGVKDQLCLLRVCGMKGADQEDSEEAEDQQEFHRVRGTINVYFEWAAGSTDFVFFKHAA